MSDLIDTTEMYLRTIFELIEERVPPLRARIAERLHQSGPTVSQTVSRMERDGLLAVAPDRTIKLTHKGMQIARGVMRKHRLAERLLMDVIGLDWEKVHDEACRWEHVISTDVEKRLVKLLGQPTSSPYGNPIPAMEELGVDAKPVRFSEGVVRLCDVPDGRPVRLVVARMSEHLQAHQGLLSKLAEGGIRPGAEVSVTDDGLTIVGPDGQVRLTPSQLELLFVAVSDGE
ncbi:metal-dependent transcriptional regulator [Tessaracoccus sp. OH4464_COT-324]|uniref:metal-dependent transcriptional regulator n=1 Tax=Tessaracoccus sp. OH4464_COT-324 TaxID=2491059 RepID=UPI000F62CD76|nr:metal-dependent transcriptional regulator [Tessaracoccus sp. OH4464_COT-324]RRD46699.1 metal-dependent transcriptional regulator [Tessaracoccus sp. OH4464_COT-324]